MTTYRNLFHNPHDPQYGPREITTDAIPTEFQGYLIYERVRGVVWDVVKDGVCVTQRAGINGAREWIGYEVADNCDSASRLLRFAGYGHRKPYRLRNMQKREVFRLDTGEPVADMTAAEAHAYALSKLAA
jgi:hypothetical protein